MLLHDLLYVILPWTLVSHLVVALDYEPVLDIDPYSKETRLACEHVNFAPIGCSIFRGCLGKEQGMCRPQSVWNDVCFDDASGLQDRGICERYKKSCSQAAHPAAECNSGLPSILKVSEVRSLIKEICTEMPNMKHCKICGNGECDQPFLQAYVPLCASMPGMHECKQWKNICGNVDEEHFKNIWKCFGDDADEPPPMRMYLHSSTVEYILFSWWVPRTTLGFSAACLFCFSLGLLSSFVRIFRMTLEAEWAMGEEKGTREWLRPQSYRTNAKRSGLIMAASLLDFLVMLVVMTFNIGIIISSVLGLGLGHFLFGHMAGKHSVPSCCGAG